MTQKEELATLREEVAELRKQITALLDIERIIARQPQVITYPTYPQPFQPSWPNYWINQPTVTSQASGNASRTSTVWNTGSAS